MNMSNEQCASVTVLSVSVTALLLVTATACNRERASNVRGGATTSASRVYVTNEASGDISVIDTTSQTVVATVMVGKRPRGIKVSPDGRYLYVALSRSQSAPPGVDESKLPAPDRSADGIGEVDTGTNRLTRVIPAGNDPEQLDVSADGTRLFVANRDAAKSAVGGVQARK